MISTFKPSNLRALKLFLFAVMAMLALPLHAQNGMEMKVFTLENRDAQSLVSVAQQMVGPNGRVSVDRQSNALVVLATPAQLKQLDNVISQLDGASKQVMMTVYVAEVTQATERKFGLRTEGQVVLSDIEFEAVLNLLDKQEGGSIKTYLTATTMSNRPAYLQISSDKFIPTAQQQGPRDRETTYYDRVPVGEFLEVLPRVNADGSIQVALTPTVSRSGEGDGIIKRTATTNVVVPDGGTIAIGGASTQVESNIQQNVPRTDIPIGQGEKSSSSRVIMFLTATTDAAGNLGPGMQMMGSDLTAEELEQAQGINWRKKQHTK